MTTAAQQNAAAHRQLRAMGWSEERIATQDEDVERHIQRQARIARGENPKPVAIGWCDEHRRYYRYDSKGCRPDNIPGPIEIGNYYLRRAARS